VIVVVASVDVDIVVVDVATDVRIVVSDFVVDDVVIGDVNVDIVVDIGGDVVVIVVAVVSDSPGATTTNFMKRARVIVEIVKVKKDMPMIATQRQCFDLFVPIFLVGCSLYTRLLYILCFTINCNIKKTQLLFESNRYFSLI
jgi:hypothetical protein